MILNGGDWNVVFNSITRAIYVLWSGVLLVFGLNRIHELRTINATIIALLTIPLMIFVTEYQHYGLLYFYYPRVMVDHYLPGNPLALRNMPRLGTQEI